MQYGLVSKIETFATLDGGGIRVAVFFQGCPLKCVYCHNPDMQKIFPCHADVSREKTFVAASSGAKNYRVSVYSPKELADKILRYKFYISRSGGVTFTGGEPLLYADFLTETALILKDNNINIAVDTSGSVFNGSVKKLLSLCDTVIADIKFSNADDYKKYTGGDFETVCSFLKFIKDTDKKIILRTVIVPNLNDNEKSIAAYADFIKSLNLNDKITEYELLPFHTMGFSKYDDFGIENKLKNVPALNESTVNSLQKYLDYNIRF